MAAVEFSWRHHREHTDVSMVRVHVSGGRSLTLVRGAYLGPSGEVAHHVTCLRGIWYVRPLPCSPKLYVALSLKIFDFLDAADVPVNKINLSEKAARAWTGYKATSRWKK